MRKPNTQKGITLIALIITIVVLLILAVVAIAAIQNENILGHANNSALKYNQAVQNEQDILGGYLSYLNNLGGSTDGESSETGDGSETDSGEGTTQTVANLKNTVLSTTSNTDVYDEYGNKIVVPAGFKIRVDETTNNADTVTEGIVIEDGSNGNQFVWIPVGKIYTDTAKTEENAKTITMGRYVFDSNGEIDTSLSKANPADKLKEESAGSYSYIEGLKDSSTSNSHARDIEAFISSTDSIMGNGGYYIGRYEARKNAAGDLTTVSTDSVWNSVNQATASRESKEMYPDGYKTDGTGTFSSDLINSYAWDTTILFLQTFDNRDRTQYPTPYSRQNSLNTSFFVKGTTTDVICNVYDMASNCMEFSTETMIGLQAPPCVARGSTYIYSDLGNYYANKRHSASTNNDGSHFSFRPILYL